MAINWKLRWTNRSWWMSIIPAIMLCMQAMAACFGVRIDLGDKTDTILAAVNSIFAVLTLVGVSSDPTTPEWGDSARALSYVTPGKTADEVAGGQDLEESVRELVRMLRKEGADNG